MLNQRAVDDAFRALADPTRRAIVEQISRRPASASELAGPLRITLAAVVQHLQLLEQSGLVTTQKIGRVRTCRIEPAGFAALERWMAERRSLWERRLDRLGEILAEPEAPRPEPRRPEIQKTEKSKRKKK